MHEDDALWPPDELTDKSWKLSLMMTDEHKISFTTSKTESYYSYYLVQDLKCFVFS